jgi:hypothetical protein
MPLNTERTEHKTYRTRNEARADVRLHQVALQRDPASFHDGYLSPVEFERKLGFSLTRVSIKSAATQMIVSYARLLAS